MQTDLFTYCSPSKTELKTSDQLFDNLPEIIRVDEAAGLLGLSRQTVYDWKYRQKTRNIPQDMFIKVNRLLFIRTAALKRWVIEQNPFLGSP